MRGYIGAFAIIFVSLVLSFIGAYNLVRIRKYLVLTVYLILVIGYPISLYVMFTTSYIREMPEWLALSIGGFLAALSPVWLMSGFMIYRFAEDIEK